MEKRGPMGTRLNEIEASLNGNNLVALAQKCLFLARFLREAELFRRIFGPKCVETCGKLN